jgi:hypothetical protein
MAFSTSVKRKTCTLSAGKEVDSLKVDMSAMVEIVKWTYADQIRRWRVFCSVARRDQADSVSDDGGRPSVEDAARADGGRVPRQAGYAPPPYTLMI